jgi:hypothetical protein
MKQRHAQHNKELCLHLLDKGTHNDWVITTAFYSAIHFIDHKLFPLTYTDGIRYTNIDDLHITVKRIYHSKHSLREHLVNLYLPLQATNYSVLKTSCWVARYDNYIVTTNRAKICKNRLETIENACIDAVTA